MKKSFKLIALMALAFTPTLLTGCNQETGTTSSSPTSTPSSITSPSSTNKEVKVTGVTISKSDSNVLYIGSTLQLEVTIAPIDATNKEVTYSSSDESVATVNKDGLVSGIKAGSVTITVTTKDGNKQDQIELVVKEKPITEGDSYYFEGEEAKMSSGELGGIIVKKDDANAKNNTSLANINCNTGATLTYKVEANEACRVGLYLNLAFGVSTVEHILNLSVNDSSIEIPASFQAIGEANWVTYAEYFLANIDLIKGENTIVLTVTGACGNYDYMKIVSSEELSLIKEAEPKPEDPITEGENFYFEGEEATLTSGELGGINVKKDDTNAKNNTSLANINLNRGATVTYKIKAAEACKAGLYLNLAFGSAVADNIFTLTVNSNSITIPTSFQAIGDANWVTYAEYFLANVDLIEGENTIVLTVTGICGNYDYMKLISSKTLSLIKEPEPEPDTPITTGNSYYYEGEDAQMTPGVFGNISVNKNDANARNNTSLGGINSNNGATLTYKVKASDTCKAGLYLNLAFGGATVENIFTLSVNDNLIEIPTSFQAIGNANWVTYAEYYLANVNLVKGDNTIVLTVTGGCGNYDYMKLVTEGTLIQESMVEKIDISTTYELLKVGESVTLSSEISPATATNKDVQWNSSDSTIASVDENGVVKALKEGNVIITATAQDGSNVTGNIRIFVSNKTGDRYEAEDAVLTNCQKEVNGMFVGGINNAGAKVTFTVTSEGQRTALLRISTSVVNVGENKIDCFYDVTLNGSNVDLSKGTFASRGATGWNTPSGFYTVEVTLEDGSNTIELISKGTHVATTLDYIEIL